MENTLYFYVEAALEMGFSAAVRFGRLLYSKPKVREVIAPRDSGIPRSTAASSLCSGFLRGERQLCKQSRLQDQQCPTIAPQALFFNAAVQN